MSVFVSLFGPIFYLLSLCACLCFSSPICFSLWVAGRHFFCIYAGMNIPISRFSATHKLNLKILQDCMSPGTLKGVMINFLSHSSAFIRLSPLILTGLNWWFPCKHVSAPIWTHTYTDLWLTLNHTYLYTHTYVHTYIHTYMYSHLLVCLYICSHLKPSLYTTSPAAISKVGNHSWGQPEGSLFNSYDTEVSGKALLLSLDCFPLLLIRTLYYWVLSKAVPSTILKIFSMMRPGIEPRFHKPLANTLPSRPISGFVFIYEYIFSISAYIYVCPVGWDCTI